MCSFQVDPEPGLVEAVARLESAAAQVAALVQRGELDDLPMAALPEITLSLHRSADRARAAATVAAGHVHRSGVMPDGHVSVRRWLQVRAGLSGSQASATIARASALRETYVDTASAWLDGAVSDAQVRALTQGVDLAMRALPLDDREEQRAQAEELLLAEAPRRTADELARIIAHLRVVVDPDGATQAQLDAHDDQHLTLTPCGWGVSVAGFLSHETAALVSTALDQIVDHQHRSGALAAEHRVEGDDGRAARERRLRRPHLNALALGHLCGQALESGSLGTHHGAIPRITLTASLELLESGIGGELLLPGREEPAVLVPAAVRRLLCDAEITQVVESGCTRGQGLTALLEKASETVLYVGRAHRVVPPRLRRALERRDRHCAFPDCQVDVGRTRAHHVEHWERGGSTDIANCVLVCERHHHSVHEGGWTPRATGSDPRRRGYWTFDPPPRRRRT